MTLLAALAARAPLLAAAAGLPGTLDALLGWALRWGAAAAAQAPAAPAGGGEAAGDAVRAAWSPLAREAAQLGEALLCVHRRALVVWLLGWAALPLARAAPSGAGCM
jgi:hypothetical protein